MSRLMLFPGELRIVREGGIADTLRVFVVDYEAKHGWGVCTCILRETVPLDVTWTGSRLPGFIFQTDAEDVAVDLAAAEVGAIP